MFASFGPDAYRNPMSTFINPDTIGKAQQELDRYTAGYNAQVKAQEDAIRAEQEAERKRIEAEQKRIQEQIEAQEQKEERIEEYGVEEAKDVPGVIENRRRQAAVDKASSMAVRMTSRGTRGRRGTSAAPGRGRGFFDRYFA
jgi:phage host-nuclease inhibitor protein Gam